MPSSRSESQLSTGTYSPPMSWGQRNQQWFSMWQLLSQVNTATLVMVDACDRDGGVDSVGLVDVVPLVEQIDGKGKTVEHKTIYNVPYFRLQGGKNAVIIDPEPGDIGICVFASRDISKVKEDKQSSAPPTRRKFSWSDGLYIGGLLNEEPEQYVQYNADGITIYSPSTVTIRASDIVLESDGLTHNGTNISDTHVHTKVQRGNDTTGEPQ